MVQYINVNILKLAYCMYVCIPIPLMGRRGYNLLFDAFSSLVTVDIWMEAKDIHVLTIGGSLKTQTLHFVLFV